MEDMVSDGTTIIYHLWNEVYYRNDMWWGCGAQRGERGISISKLIIEISEKKKNKFVLFLYVFGKCVRLLLLSSGDGHAERSRNVLLAIKR